MKRAFAWGAALLVLTLLVAACGRRTVTAPSGPKPPDTGTPASLAPSPLDPAGQAAVYAVLIGPTIPSETFVFDRICPDAATPGGAPTTNCRPMSEELK